MDAATIIAAIGKVLKTAADLGPTIISAIEDAKPFAEEIYALFKGADVTQEQLDALEAKVDELAAELQEPLPPEVA